MAGFLIFNRFSQCGKNVGYSKGRWLFAKEYQLVTQYGTHIDAPVHFVEERVSVDQLPIKDFMLPLIVINKEKLQKLRLYSIC